MFYAGWFCSSCPFDLFTQTLVKNWCCIIGGYILGSVLLIIASYVMLLELVKSGEQQTRQETDVESPFLGVPS